MKTAVVQTRVDLALKKEADAFFESIGMDTTTAIRIFLKQTLIQHKIPFEIIQDDSFYSEKNIKDLENSKNKWKMDTIQYTNLLKYKNAQGFFR